VETREKIRTRALELGFDACRFTTADRPLNAGVFERWLAAGAHGEMGYLQRNAAKRVQPDLVLPGAESIITLAATYHRHDANDGTIARYARYSDYHDVLGEHLKILAEYVTASGGDGTRSLWYVDTGPLLERDLAQRAGLGFIGKHTNLISRELGNWFFLAEIITTVSLTPDEPEKNHCGTCSRCITTCPTQAILAPFQLDARRCISYLTIELKGAIPDELRPAIGNRIYGCDDCLAVCPWNRFAREGSIMKDHVRTDLDAPNLVELLSLDEHGFRERFKGTPIMRTKRRGFLRNVCVALGNVGDDSALPALERAALDPEPLIAEHARWAIDQISSRKKSRRASRKAMCD
jgi:epoxyqueuosine reductase